MTSLQDSKVDLLLTRLDELVRWRPGAKGQYQDLHSAVARLKGSANHIILGRRGSGKTRLLDELKRAVLGEKTIVVTIGAEEFKELTYPDILIQILRSFLREFQTILEHRPFLLQSVGGAAKRTQFVIRFSAERERRPLRPLPQMCGSFSVSLIRCSPSPTNWMRSTQVSQAVRCDKRNPARSGLRRHR